MEDESEEDRTDASTDKYATFGDSFRDLAEERDIEFTLPDQDEHFWYPTVEDIVGIHETIIEEDPDSEPGIENPDRIQFAIDSIKHGRFSEKPETIHEKAFTLIRLIASNHWFVDGNKRTALNTANLCYQN